MTFPQSAAFIVGAPRCGTSSLWRLFRQHPGVCFSTVKEPHFFSRFDLDSFAENDLKELVTRGYVNRFFDAREEGQLLMEASPTYFYAPDRMRTILRLWPEAKFLVALRDPMAMIPSLHSRLLITGDETITDLERAWSLIPERREGRKIPRSCIDARFLRYDEAARFATHLRNFVEVVGEKRCHVVLLDDLSSDPVATYEAICRFLDLTPEPGTQFRIDRTNRSCRLKWLQRLLNRPPKRFQTWLASDQFLQREGIPREKIWFIRSAASLRKRVLRWNEYSAPRPELGEKLKAEIGAHYKNEVSQLSKMLGRDLSHWLRT